MGSRVYLSNLNADIPGYKLALVDTRNPRPPAITPTAVTTTTGGGSNIQMTAIAGGTPLAWITRPLGGPFTPGATTGETLFANISGLESDKTVNAGVQLRLSRYTAGAEQDAFVTSNDLTPLATTLGPNMWASEPGSKWTATPTFAPGDRLVIKAYLNNAGGSMGDGTTTMAYDGTTAAGAGDSWVEFLSTLNVLGPQLNLGPQSRQVNAAGVPIAPYAGNPPVPFIGQKSVSFFQDFVWQSTGANVLPPALGGVWPFDMTVGAMLAEAGLQAATTQ